MFAGGAEGASFCVRVGDAARSSQMVLTGYDGGRTLSNQVMHILSIEAISKNYGRGPLFENVSLGFDSSDRVGVVGVNGSGKTTLLRLIAGEERPDAGRIVFAEDVSLGYLPQNPPFDPSQTVLDAVFAANNARMRLLHDYERACQALAAAGQGEERLLNRVSELAHELEASGAWELETNAR